ncbi:MAG: cyclase family protein [Bacteroidales bacterium]|jgi:arylformamidase|nr:cyclase family protein [Bacteroidales bacterium]
MFKDFKIIDISKELTTTQPYPGDRAAIITRIHDMAVHDDCNLSELTMNLHNATHIDAPLHYIENGLSIEQIAVDKCIGAAIVVNADRLITPAFKEHLTNKKVQRVLVKGDLQLTPEVVQLLVAHPILLIGTENNTIGNPDIHKQLLSQEIVVLENITLEHVSEGDYFLFAAPIKIANAEGAPCRALLQSFRD